MSISEHDSRRFANRKTRGRLALGYVGIALAVVALILAKPWLKATIGGEMFSWIVAAVAIVVMSAGSYVSIRWQRGLDEVEEAGQRFAARWGMMAGTMAFALLMALPPFKDFATAIVIDVQGAGANVDRSVVIAMLLGFAGVVLLQSLGMTVFRAIWWKSKQ